MKNIDYLQIQYFQSMKAFNSLIKGSVASLCLLLNFGYAQEYCEYNGSIIDARILTGNHATHPDVIQRELDPSSVFQCDTWTSEKNRLESLGIFGEVTLHIKTLNIKSNQVTLEYQFKELKPWLPIPTLKKSDQVGWMIGPGIAAVNLLGRDIFVQAFYRTDVYPKLNTTDEFLIAVQSPYVGDIPFEYSFGWLKLNTMNLNKDFEENSHDIQFSGKYPIWSELQVVMLGNAYLVGRNADPRFARSEGTSKSLGMGAGLAWDSRDNLTNPRGGFYNEVSFTKLGGKFLQGNESDFSETLWDFQAYQSFNKHIFLSVNLLRWRNGKVPFYETFETGGANSFRAWLPGPNHSGESELLLNLEYRYELVPKTSKMIPYIDQSFYWGLQPVLGYEIINLWSQKSQGNEIAQAYYGGVHILLPALNRLRVEFGSEVSRLEIVTQIGLFEKSETSRWRIR